jgi:hypothetical protein
VSSAVLSFFAAVLSGYRRFLFFIDGVPFFNAPSFLVSKAAIRYRAGQNQWSYISVLFALIFKKVGSSI